MHLKEFFMDTSNKVVVFITSAVCAVLLAGCGGGGGGSTASVAAPSLSGLAATGAGIANAPVTAKCATGTPLTGTTDANGSFNLVLGGRTLPCMLQVTGGTPAVTLHSFAQAAGRVNITPVTDLIVSSALGADPATVFTAYTPTNGSTVEAGLATAKTYVATQLNAITGGGISNPMTGAFSVGDADDKILDALANALGNASKTVADLRVVAQAGGTMTGSVPAFLATPANPTATANSDSQITVGWTAVAGASSYKVYRASSTGTVNVGGSEIGTATTNSYVDSGLTASTTYFYKVVAFNGVVPAGSAASAEATATTSASSGSGGGLTCDTSLFQSVASVRTPTSIELATFARTYSGSEGDYGSNPGDPFVATGSATLVFNADGTATYNGASYAITSYCLETLSGGAGSQLVINAGAMSHFDLKTTGWWSGFTAAGKAVTDAAYSGGGVPSTWTPHALPGNTGSFADVVWDGSKFVAIGTYVGTSIDGANWTLNALVEGKGIAKSGSTLLLAGISTSTGSDIRKSVNGGTTWAKPVTANIFTVTGNAAMFVGIGGGAEAGNGQAMVLRTSSDGEAWTTRYTEAVPNAQSKITSLKPIWSGSKWLVSAVTYNPLPSNFYDKYQFFVLTSTDGNNWTKTVVTNVKGSYIWPWWPVWTGVEFALIDRTKTLKSSDGVTWPATATTSNFTSFGENTYDYVSYTGTEFVAFSGGGATVKVWTSADAVSWTSRTTSATQPIYGGATNGSIYVAVGNQYVFTSP
jgi:hypothetical protein